MIEGAIIQRLSSDEVDDSVVEVFLLEFRREINIRVDGFLPNNK